MRLRLIVVAVVAALTVSAAAGAATGIHRFIGVRGIANLDCEVAAGVPGLGTFVYCLSAPTPAKAVSVQMSAAGKLSICHGTKCMSNPPDNVTMLRQDQSLKAGPFRCTTVKTGIRCLITKLGHGFLIGPHGLTRL
jgi:hypothetical protein